jgi:protein ImuA
VVGETDRLDLTASRRLQLAAQASGVTCFVLRTGRGEANNAAVTRWQVSSVPGLVYGSTGLDDHGAMRGRWRVRLLRCRGAVPAEDAAGFGSWLVTEGDPRHAAEAEPETQRDLKADSRASEELPAHQDGIAAAGGSAGAPEPSGSTQAA